MISLRKSKKSLQTILNLIPILGAMGRRRLLRIDWKVHSNGFSFCIGRPHCMHFAYCDTFSSKRIHRKHIAIGNNAERRKKCTSHWSSFDVASLRAVQWMNEFKSVQRPVTLWTSSEFACCMHYPIPAHTRIVKLGKKNENVSDNIANRTKPTTTMHSAKILFV